MNKATFTVVDVSTWPRAHEETLGTKPKRWLQQPDTGDYWLMKDVTFNKRADGSTYAKGDDWAERIAFGIAEKVGLPAATIELADGGHGPETAQGVISRTVLTEGESLIHGNELLEETGVIGDDPHDRTGYTLDAVRTVLDRIDPPSQAPELSAWEVFVGYLVLDALVGNVDRHQENWAAIAVGSSRRLAATFDHASCLGFQLDDEQRLERLETADGNRTPEGYAERARSRFEGGPSPLELAVEALASIRPNVRDRWLKPCSQPEGLGAIVDLVPDDRMSKAARAFAKRVLRHNANQLSSHPFGTVK